MNADFGLAGGLPELSLEWTAVLGLALVLACGLGGTGITAPTALPSFLMCDGMVSVIMGEDEMRSAAMTSWRCFRSLTAPNSTG